MQSDRHEGKHRSGRGFPRRPCALSGDVISSSRNLEDLHGESLIAVEETMEIFAQALKALQYLHSRGVAHRDLKSENILIEFRSPLSIKLADFNLANDRPDLKTVCGTQQYTAPEITWVVNTRPRWIYGQ